MASPAALAATLEGTRGGLGLFGDPDTASLYRAVGDRFNRSRVSKSVHLVNQRSGLRFDHLGSLRNHRLGLLRFSAAKSRCRIEAIGIKSKQVDRFVNAVWLNPELEFRFRSTRMQSVELIIEALDLLSRTASRYGRCGRKVFEVNQEPIMSAMRLIECLPLADTEEVLVGPLEAWLEHPPEFDPEGWALPLFGEF